MIQAIKKFIGSRDGGKKDRRSHLESNGGGLEEIGLKGKAEVDGERGSRGREGG